MVIRLGRAFYVNVGLAVLSGWLTAMAFPNPWYGRLDWPGGFLAWLALVPLFFIREKNGLQIIGRWGYLYGLVYFGVATVWMATMKAMSPIGPLVWMILIGYLALYPACFLISFHWARMYKVPGWWSAPVIWVVLEFIRNYFVTGFPWVALGYSQSQNVWMLKLAPVTGMWGISACVVLCNYLIYLGLDYCFIKIKGSVYLSDFKAAIHPDWRYLASIVIVVMVGYGLYQENRLTQNTPAAPSVRIAALQGNIDQDQTWDVAYTEHSLAVYSGLLQTARKSQAALVIWPETTFPGVFNYEYGLANRVKSWSKEGRVAQLVGADEVSIARQGEYLYFNSVMLLDQQGNQQGSTSKLHLVPFGEYVPFKDNLLFFIDKLVKRYGGAGFTPGIKRSLLEWHATPEQKIPLGCLICFESLFPQYSVELVRKGAQILIVTTNDAWFGKTAASAQHTLFSAMRAAETKRYVIHAAATGISAIYDPAGHLCGMLENGNLGVIIHDIVPQTHQSFFVQWGNWFAWLLCGIMGWEILCNGGLHWRRHRNKKK